MKTMLILLFILLISCSSNQEQPSGSLYFPPVGSNSWETRSFIQLGWNNDAVQPLLNYLESQNTKSFLVLHEGRIVMEHYFDGHSESANWYWASAGKTLTATMAGIAAQDGLLSIEDKVSDHIGLGWTKMTPERENLIRVKHLLTMTSGIDDSNGDCVSPECLTYYADAGSRWAYHNVFVKLQDVIGEASGMSFEDYFNSKLRDRIGMNGSWFVSGENIVYASTARSAARFGLLMLNRGKWEDDIILENGFFDDATSSSQNINESYGYLWWLNGKESYRLPQTQLEFSGSLIPSAPADMFMALGKNDQKIYVVPSKKIVVIRMGNAADDVNWALSSFDNELWEKINLVINP